MSSATQPVKVDIWSDIACPWCYIGKRRFETAVVDFTAETGRQVDIEYHSFELAPDTPVDFDGTESDFLAAHKGLPREQVAQMLAQVTGIAASVGLSYDFDKVRHTKTLAAHQALHFAKKYHKQLELKERMLKAYFEEGRHVGRVEELAALGAEVGLDPRELTAALNSGEFAESVDADIAQARAYGINGVPFFVIDSAFGVSGAQEPEVFLAALRQSTQTEESSPA